MAASEHWDFLHLIFLSLQINVTNSYSSLFDTPFFASSVFVGLGFVVVVFFSAVVHPSVSSDAVHVSVSLRACSFKSVIMHYINHMHLFIFLSLRLSVLLSMVQISWKAYRISKHVDSCFETIKRKQKLRGYRVDPPFQMLHSLSSSGLMRFGKKRLYDRTIWYGCFGLSLIISLELFLRPS